MYVKDLIAQGITLIENIFIKRKKFNKSHAVYLLYPDLKSVHAFINDYNNPEKT